MKSNLLNFNTGTPLHEILQRLERIQGNYDVFQRYIYDSEDDELASTELWSIFVKLQNDNLLLIQFNEDDKLEFATELTQAQFSGTLSTAN